MRHWVAGTTQIDLFPLVVGLKGEKSRRGGSLLISAGLGGSSKKIIFSTFFGEKNEIRPNSQGTFV